MKQSTVDLGGPVSYIDFGGSGEAMVLVHGIGGAAIGWTRVAPALAAGHRVLALDLVGFGLTRLLGRSATVQANADLVETFIDRVAGGPAVLVGHSMGGMISILAAARYPAAVSRMVLLAPVSTLPGSPAPGIPTPVMQAMSFMPRLGALLGSVTTRARGAEATVRQGMNMGLARPADFDPGLMQMTVDLERERMRDPLAYAGYLEAWISMRRMFSNPDDFAAEVRAVRAPTLLLQGAVDHMVPASSAAALAALRPDWTYVEMAQEAHNIQMESPGKFSSAVLEWLSRTPG